MLTPLEFAERVLLLKEEIPFSVSSWGRTDVHNAAVGGVSKSAHRRWLGIDVIPDTPSPENFAALSAAAGRLDLEIINEWDAKKHWHIQPMGWVDLAW